MSNLIKILVFFIPLFIGCSPTNSIYGEQTLNLVEHNNMHFINIVLNGKRCKLLVDTGASKSLLDITQAEKYSFSYMLLRENQYIGLGGLQDIYVVFDYVIDDFYITFLGTDLSEIQKYFSREGFSIIGVLGSDFLEERTARIDFNLNKLYYNPK